MSSNHLIFFQVWA